MNKYKKIFIQKFDVSSQEPRYLLICEDKYYDANYNIVELLLILQETDNINLAISIYQEKYHNRLSRTEIRDAIYTYIDPIFKDVGICNNFIWNYEIVNAKLLRKVSKCLDFLFYEKLMFVVCLFALVLNLYFFINTSDVLNFNNVANIDNIIVLLIFVFMSSLFHELGHASACTKKNVKHGGIGFGLYLNFPILYTDVTAIWKLARKERCVVNIAGVYFQCYVLIFLILLFQIFHNDILRYMILTINFGFLFTLNPFFKFDGYWIASDLLGVPNLRAKSKALLLFLFYKKSNLCSNDLKIKGNKRILFIVYSILVNIFMLYYFLYIIPCFLWCFFRDFPDEIHQLSLYISCDIYPSFTLIRNIASQLLLLLLISYMICCKIIVPAYYKWIK